MWTNISQMSKNPLLLKVILFFSLSYSFLFLIFSLLFSPSDSATFLLSFLLTIIQFLVSPCSLYSSLLLLIISHSLSFITCYLPFFISRYSLFIIIVSYHCCFSPLHTYLMAHYCFSFIVVISLTRPFNYSFFFFPLQQPNMNYFITKLTKVKIYNSFSHARDLSQALCFSHAYIIYFASSLIYTQHQQRTMGFQK